MGKIILLSPTLVLFNSNETDPQYCYGRRESESIYIYIRSGSTPLKIPTNFYISLSEFD